MTTISTTPARQFGGWLKYGAVILATIVVCWAIVIWFWHTTGRNPGTGELALALLVLPATLLLGVWGGRKLFAATAALAVAAPSKSASSPAAAGIATAAPALAIVATALRSPYGASAEELADAIADNEARADLDKELVDEHGFPVMAARCEDAQDEALQDEITEWLSGQEFSAPHLDEEQWRALILASGVAAELASRAADELMPAEGAPPVLQLRLLLPQDWDGAVRLATAKWLTHVVSQYGWPVDKIAVPDLLEQAQPLTPTALLTQLVPATPAPPVPLLAVVIACASLIGQESVDRLAARSLLFTSSSQVRGQTPGEGAAGILLADLGQAQLLGHEDFTLLGPLGERRLDTSADDARRSDATVLLELAEQLGKAGAIDLSQISMVVADTGHRSNRVLELMGLGALAIPQVDASDDIVRIGLGSGSCGAVPFITVLALAQHYARERNAPVLCVSNEDPFLRAAALVCPMALA
ncbi:MAG: hypothetical protein ACRYGO_18260 [Janthinobacterium lividum]